jgi:hypothetical protein
MNSISAKTWRLWASATSGEPNVATKPTARGMEVLRRMAVNRGARTSILSYAPMGVLGR